MKYQILILAISFYVSAITAQKPVPTSNSGKGATPLSTANSQQSGVNKNTYAVVVGISDYQDPAICDLLIMMLSHLRFI